MKRRELEQIVTPLPRKEREELLKSPPAVAQLEEKVRQCKQAMNRDLWVGIPWFLLYCFSLFYFGISAFTATILAVGALYFVYSAPRHGSFGMNRKRVKVYEELLGRLKD
ncbi:MAG: hypothetical protein KDC43_07855 [Saprospiraceae bacterium]|nr:hypothetical protein [Saprospiraceae bacterium]MCB0623816.1 hypothetical protein [Saprospiraceae bacterium]MCB0675139.1 hypothetical protein [Saprospiraceae bacterium]MCB0679385.1 hypothetical protein [Saprospiraceae bacterium]